ncbi:MAG: methyltransferase domain-containing protein [Candidatus Electrothrix sp. AR4]|nr:methyltransferase domain-containing protein [Candidatus Electrothrix sp. AR4]
MFKILHKVGSEVLVKFYSQLKSKKSTDIYQIFPEMAYPIQYPDGETEESLLNYLTGFRLEGSTGNELEGYLKQDFKRFVYTLNLLPEKHDESLLEIGANPYFTSILLKKYTNYRLFFTNYFGIEDGMARQTHNNPFLGETFEFEYINHNVDNNDIPFDEKFDVILFCEVLEHLVNDPMQAILRIKKSLKENGILILSTPNVNRLENISKMISGTNIYDPYSGYGVYGRHNREYNKHELLMLLSHCGFEIEKMFTSDVHVNHSNAFFPVDKFSEHILDVKHRELDIGQYIFVRAKNVFPAKHCKPTWLFRSYPENELCG